MFYTWLHSHLSWMTLLTIVNFVLIGNQTRGLSIVIEAEGVGMVLIYALPSSAWW
jgi:hypothetical protein